MWVAMIHNPPALPGILQSIAPVLDHYGYLAVGGFVCLEDFGVPVPGETVLIGAALYAGAGRLNVVLVGLIGILAAIIGDNIGYVIGRLVGREVIIRWGKYVFLNEERVAKAELFFKRQGGKIVVVARFIEGLRQANGIVAGLTEMPWIRFLFFNTIGATLWVGLWVGVGYSSGSHIQTIYNFVDKSALLVLIVACVAILGLIIFMKHRRRVRSKTDPVSDPNPSDPNPSDPNPSDPNPSDLSK